VGILINGKYYKDPSQAPKQDRAVVGGQLQAYNIASQATKHDMDLIQPWNNDGTPNPEFKKYYPKEAIEYGME
jgi:hypothetical protein